MELYSAGVALKLLEGVSCSARKEKKKKLIKGREQEPCASDEKDESVKLDFGCTAPSYRSFHL